MGAKSYMRGHPIEYIGGCWRYSDNGAICRIGGRECIRCGKMPTPEGHDACLGHIEGVTSACCGHGASTPIMVLT